MTRFVSKSLRRMMSGGNDMVALRRVVGVDDHSQKTHQAIEDGAAWPMRAHIEQIPRVIRSGDGQEITASTTVYLDQAAEQIDPDDLLVLPDGTEERIVWVETNQDRKGWHATVVYLE